MIPACLPAIWVSGYIAQKRNNCLCPSFCLEESCPPASILMPDTSVPFCMPLVPFKLLPWVLDSEGVGLIKSVLGFFKRNGLGLQKFLPPTQSPLVFAARNCGDLLSWHWNPGLGGLVWVWASSLLDVPPEFFSTWVWDQPILCLCPSYPSGWM